MLALFKKYPALGEKLPFTALGNYPTPVHRCNKLTKELGIGNLAIKCDDVSGDIYGGNKIRKLEFILGKALDKGYHEVLTYGGAGSNHALATALYAEKLGLDCITLLGPQPNARSIGKTLLRSYQAGADIHYFGNYRAFGRATRKIIIARKKISGRFPMIIPVGGTTALGTAGFVNAGIELAEQINAGEIDTPSYIYVAMGSMGTAVGIALGLRAMNIPSKVVAVALLGKDRSNLDNSLRLYEQTAGFLHTADPSFPLLGRETADIEVRQEFAGSDYGLYTTEGAEAAKLMREHENIALDGTYTAKTLAALIHDARKGRFGKDSALFWNTYNSRDYGTEIKDLDYHELPRTLHRFFEEDIQPLDR